jgi:hypothetical protein
VNYPDSEVSGSIPGTTKFSVFLGLERGPLSLLRIIEDLLDGKSSGFVLET